MSGSGMTGAPGSRDSAQSASGEVRNEFWLEQLLIDRVIIANDDRSVGMVDDIELSEEEEPRVVAFLCGPLAFGARLGGRLGLWWAAIGHRMRLTSDDQPVRIPISLLARLDHSGVRLTVSSDEAGPQRLHDWMEEHIIGRLPGSTEKT